MLIHLDEVEGPGGPGGEMPLVAAARVVNGRFSAPPRVDRRLLLWVAYHGGLANMMLTVLGEGFEHTEWFTWTFPPTPAAPRAALRAQAPPAAAGPRFAIRLSPAERTLPAARTRDFDFFGLISTCGNSRRSTPVGQPFARNVIVGEMHTSPGMRGLFRYDLQTGSRFGVVSRPTLNVGAGASGEGASAIVSGTISFGGSHARSVENTAYYATDVPEASSVYIRGKFAFRIYRVDWEGVNDKHCGGAHYEARPLWWNGAVWPADPAPRGFDGLCRDRGDAYNQQYQPGHPFTKIAGGSHVYAHGFSVFGVGASSQTSESVYSRMIWYFGSHRHRYMLCGDTAAPPTAQRVYAGGGGMPASGSWA